MYNDYLSWPCICNKVPVTAAVLKNVSSQNFAFKSPIINYILDQTSSNVLSKLYKICKHFYSKKRFIIFEEIRFSDETVYTVINGCPYVISPQEYVESCKNIKIGVSKEMYCHVNELTFQSELIKTIFKCDVQQLEYRSLQPITWKEFELLAKTPKKLYLIDLKIVECNNENPPLEEVLLRTPNARLLTILPCRIASETSDNLLKIQRTHKLSAIGLYVIRGFLDAEKFYQFLRNNAAPNSHIYVSFVTLEFKTEIQTKMLSWRPKNEMPQIKFGQLLDS